MYTFWRIMNLKPSYAKKLNPSLYSPMHLALQNHQTQMALWLFKSNKELVHVKGRDGKTPLHCAVELEELNVLAEFITGSPESICGLTSNGENALHIAVKANAYGALEMLVRWFSWYRDGEEWRDGFLNAKDKEGNSPLHTASYGNQHEAIKLLLEHKTVERNAKNLEGLTALDILEREYGSGQVRNNTDTRNMLHCAGGLKSSSLGNEKLFSQQLRSKISFCENLTISFIRGRMKITNETCNTMLVVAALIITIAFQGVLSPPGGVWQGSLDNATTNTTTSTKQKPFPGETVMSSRRFRQFSINNSLALSSAFLLTMYLLPPSVMAVLFNISISQLLLCYCTSLSLLYHRRQIRNGGHMLHFRFYTHLLVFISAYGVLT